MTKSSDGRKPFAALGGPVYRIDLRYVGTNFDGWQSQPNRRGVQDHLEEALATLLRHPVRVIGASRTDSGVHAEQQVAIFRTPIPYDKDRWLRGLNGLLPESVGVTDVALAAEDFHPVYHAQGKAYRYRLWIGPARHPHLAPYVWRHVGALDVDAMRKAAENFVGTHDFSAFCAADSGAKTRRRTVIECAVYQQGPLVEVWVVGKGFLKQMIRIMVGTLVDVGRGKKPISWVSDVLARGDRMQAGKTAPAQGLSLVEIFYGEIPDLAILRERLSKHATMRVD